MNINDVKAIAKYNEYIEAALSKYGNPLRNKGSQELAKLASKISRLQLARAPYKVNTK